MEKGIVTICIVNYKTPELTKLCLDGIRKNTRFPYKILVIDNDSRDESTEYLRSLDWITLIERKQERGVGGYEHAAALDLGLEKCQTEYFMSMHSDTFAHKPCWLTEIMSHFQDDENIVCVGSGKIDMAPQWRIWLKEATDFKTFKRKLLRKPDLLGVYRYYNRTVCTVYKTDILKQENLTFLMGKEQGLTAGKKLYFELVDRGYNTVELKDAYMKKNVWHLAHATQATNPDEFNLRNKTRRKTTRLIKKIWSSKQVHNIMADRTAGWD